MTDQGTFSVEPRHPGHPVSFEIDYPTGERDRLTVFFRIITVIPIAVVLAAVGGTGYGRNSAMFGGGLLFFAPLLLILFRQRYPRWWFDWNVALLSFTNRVVAYLTLLRDEYPSTEDEQAVHLTIPYPDAARLNRWLPLVKWLLAVPHYIALFFLYIATVAAMIVGWFAVLLTGRLPRGLFDFVVGRRWRSIRTGWSSHGLRGPVSFRCFQGV